MYDTTDVTEGRTRLERFYVHCRAAEVVELTRLARTIRRWQPQVLAWHAGLTNGPTEAVNLLIKKVKRVLVNRPPRAGGAAGWVRPWLSQLRELPAPAAAPLRRSMADSACCINAQASTTLGRDTSP